MTKQEFKIACKLLNGFEIEEGKYYKLDDDTIILIKGLFKNTIRYQEPYRDDLIIKYYHEFIDKVKGKSTSDHFKFHKIKFIHDMKFLFPEQYAKKYGN